MKILHDNDRLEALEKPTMYVLNAEPVFWKFEQLCSENVLR